MPKITIIIPIYNVEKYVSQCLNSIITQTFNDIEILCVDDKGTDNSMHIVNNYAKIDSRIKIITLERNMGLSMARNRALDEASGEYVFLCDSDDYLLPDCIENLYKAITKNNTDIAVARTKAFADDNSEATLKLTDEKNSWIEKRVCDCYQVKLENFAYDVTYLNCTAWNKLFSLKFLNDNHLRFLNKNCIHEDDGFWIKVLSNFPKITYIEQLGYMYRIRKGSITETIDEKRNKYKKLYHMRTQLKEAFSYIDKYKSDISEPLKYQIKNSNFYNKFFIFHIGTVFEFKWTLNHKYISLFNINLFSEKIKHDKIHKAIKILGITVLKRDKQQLDLTRFLNKHKTNNYNAKNIISKIFQ